MSKKIPLYYLVTALFWFSLYAFVPIIPNYAESLGASKALIGLIAGSYGFTQMLIRIPLGIFSDIIKKRKGFIFFGICCTIVSTLGMFIFKDKYALLFFRALTGVAASTWVIFIVLFSSYFQQKEAVKAVGFLNTFNSVGTMSAYFAGGVVSNVLGVRYSFMLSAFVAVIALLLSLFIEENIDLEKQPIKVSDILEVAKDRNLIFVSSIAIISQYLVFATTNSFTPMIAAELGADSFQKGLLSMVSALPGLFASVLASTILIKKFGARVTISCALLISSVCYAIVPFEKSLTTLFITQFLGGYGSTTVMALLMGLSIKNIAFEKRATAMGFFQAIYGIGMFFGPTVAGIIGDNISLSASYLITGIIGLCGAAIVFLFYKNAEESL